MELITHLYKLYVIKAYVTEKLITHPPKIAWK